MKFLLEKEANFEDIRKVVLECEELSLDSTLVDKFGPAPKEALSPEKAKEILDSYLENNELLCVGCGSFGGKGIFGQRAVLYSVACGILQLKKKFSLEIQQFVIDLLNKREIIKNTKITSAAAFMGLFVESTVEGVSSPRISEDHLKLLMERFDQYIQSGIALYIYLVNHANLKISIANFAIYQEALGCSASYLDEIKAINVNDREFINSISLPEMFFNKGNNKKGKASQDMLETLLVLNSVKGELKSIKFYLKNFFGGERNPTLKMTVAETKFAYPLWKSIGFSLQKLTHTLSNLIGLGENRLKELILSNLGEETLISQVETLDSFHGEHSSIDSHFSYTSKLRKALYASSSYQRFLEYELGLSYEVILYRLRVDRNDPKKKAQKSFKPGFKLGEGTVDYLENVIFL